ncbi:sensor histidine kinase [Streptosporangium carneum]|uniref:histidine kinase n=1 Tax=Streptosporangium carneum TaxID=47481 RepID=A0A9W6I6V9_9ACTN|nr:histidine kinase [Streptosporangium carneum]GLK12802.1 two-component sensor histidine kinase [Streptosporangium carneum]
MRAGRRAWLFLRRPRVFDTALVVVLWLSSLRPLIGSLLDHDAGVAAGVGLFLASTLPLLVRRGHPIPVAVVTSAFDIAGNLTITPSTLIPATIALYGVGRYVAARQALVVTACLATAAYVSLFADTNYQNASPFFYVLSAGVGLSVRSRTEAREREESRRAEEAVHLERRRIARELHDVVAHHISVISSLVGGARATLPRESLEAGEALLSAERTARQALTEMRHLLNVLRTDESGDGETLGAGTAELPVLVKQAVAAGLPTSLVLEGEPVTLPAAIDRAIYRIVQEALTNTRKHTSGARSTVRIGYERETVEVEVLDDGVVADPFSSGGFGLVGMAERVALCGGELTAGPRENGGFQVRARLPL